MKTITGNYDLKTLKSGYFHSAVELLAKNFMRMLNIVETFENNSSKFLVLNLMVCKVSAELVGRYCQPSDWQSLCQKYPPTGTNWKWYVFPLKHQGEVFDRVGISSFSNSSSRQALHKIVEYCGSVWEKQLQISSFDGCYALVKLGGRCVWPSDYQPFPEGNPITGRNRMRKK